MKYIGLGLGKTSSQICILSEDGELDVSEKRHRHFFTVVKQHPTCVAICLLLNSGFRPINKMIRAR